MLHKGAYDLDNATLVKNFAETFAVAQSSKESSILGSIIIQEAKYLEGVLLSRLEKIKLPFKEGDRVQIKKECAEKPEFKNKDVLQDFKISEVHYDHNKREFRLQLTQIVGLIPAEYFCLA